MTFLKIVVDHLKRDFRTPNDIRAQAILGDHVVALVSGLGGIVDEANISGGVVPIVVDAVNC